MTYRRRRPGTFLPRLLLALALTVVISVLAVALVEVTLL